MAERPVPSVSPPDVSGPQEVLERLLKLELERLETAVRIEKERRIVFPETSVIIHDVQRLLAAVEAKKGKKSGSGDFDLEALVRDLGVG